MFTCQQKGMLCCKMLRFGWSGRTDAFKSIRRVSSTVATAEGNLIIQPKLNYQAFNHRTSYVIQEYDACTELRSINSSVGSEKILHLCIEGKSIVSNAIARTVTWLWDWTSRMLNIIHLTELSSTGENCWETNIFCQDGLSHGNDQWHVIFKSHRLCQSHSLWWCIVTHYT